MTFQRWYMIANASFGLSLDYAGWGFWWWSKAPALANWTIFVVFLFSDISLALIAFFVLLRGSDPALYKGWNAVFSPNYDKAYFTYSILMLLALLAVVYRLQKSLQQNHFKNAAGLSNVYLRRVAFRAVRLACWM